jgi:REP element-mobilizing transposase RayT
MSYVSAYFHCVFSTKERERIITSDLEQRLWPFLGGIARQNQMKALEIGGIEDHVHLLLSLPATVSMAKAMQLIKGGSSKWVHDSYCPSGTKLRQTALPEQSCKRQGPSGAQEGAKMSKLQAAFARTPLQIGEGSPCAAKMNCCRTELHG